MFSPEQLKLIDVVRSIAQRSNYAVFLVGGFVRDAVRGENCSDRDVDFLVEGNAIDFAKLAQRELGGTLKTFSDFFTAKILSPDGFAELGEVDFASTRTEVYKKPGALPEVFMSKIDQDLKRRDFTINAMALSLDNLKGWIAAGLDSKIAKNYVMDLFCGVDDLAGKVIRVLHAKSFIDDPTRIFRAVRYETRIGGRMDAATECLARDAVAGGALKSISAQRKFTELKKILSETRPHSCLKRLDQLGLLGELSIVPAQHSDFWKFMAEVENLKLSSDVVQFEVAIRGFYLLTPGSERERIFRDYGFGKSSFKAWQADLAAAQASNAQSQSDVIQTLARLKTSIKALV